MARVSVQIVTWNSRKFIEDCLQALEQQTFTDFSVVIIDNDSQDESVAFVREHYPTATVLQNFKNAGFARGHNQGIQLAKGDYVLVLNPDVVLSPSFLERMVECADQHPQAASFTGKLLRMETDAQMSEDGEAFCTLKQSKIIDSTGLVMYKNRRAADRGAGEVDDGQYDKPDEVFGVSGAAALYRLSALRECAINNEYFDNVFFAYKEDVDLAWRLRLYGWTARYCSTAIGYHVRHVAAASQRTVKALTQNRKDVSKKIRALSLRNQHLLLMKNDLFPLALRHAPRIVIRELGLLGYTILFEPYQWKTWLEIFTLMPKMFVSRSIIMRHKKVSTKELRKWFV